MLGGCAASDPELPNTLATAHQVADAAPPGARRLFYVGIALYSEMWSQNDVVDLAAKLQSTANYHVVPVIASNVIGTEKSYPIAGDTEIRSLVNNAAEQARPDDLVFVDISTHGGRGVLASKLDGNPPTMVSARALAELLAPLAGRPTIVVISACYSGSLINDLRAPEWIVITAARADRSSFGCVATARHTFFGEAELHAFGQRDRSLRQVFSIILEDVARMEQEKHYTPSDPQISIGANAAALYNAPVF
jgi:hypothetical protein